MLPLPLTSRDRSDLADWLRVQWPVADLDEIERRLKDETFVAHFRQEENPYFEDGTYSGDIYVLLDLVASDAFRFGPADTVVLVRAPEGHMVALDGTRDTLRQGATSIAPKRAPIEGRR